MREKTFNSLRKRMVDTPTEGRKMKNKKTKSKELSEEMIREIDSIGAMKELLYSNVHNIGKLEKQTEGTLERILKIEKALRPPKEDLEAIGKQISDLDKRIRETQEKIWLAEQKEPPRNEIAETIREEIIKKFWHDLYNNGNIFSPFLDEIRQGTDANDFAMLLREINTFLEYCESQEALERHEKPQIEKHVSCPKEFIEEKVEKALRDMAAEYLARKKQLEPVK